MNQDDINFNNDNDIPDDLQEESKTAAEGRKVIGRRYGRTLDHVTVAPKEFDPGLDSVDIEVTPKKSNGCLLRLVSDDDAKQQIKNQLAAARFDWNQFDKKADEPLPVAANDNDVGFEKTESWPVIELLNRIKRPELIKTVLRVRELHDMAGSDPVGHAVHRPGKKPTCDYDVQRTKSGKVFFEDGRDYDRRDTNYKNPETGNVVDTRRVASRSQPMHDASDDEFFVQRRIDAQIELDEIIAAVGPLWKYLEPVICNNATATATGALTGAKGTQAPGVGTAIIKIGLNAAREAIEAFAQGKSYHRYVASRRLKGVSGILPNQGRLAA
jgi:hypothetical protein